MARSTLSRLIQEVRNLTGAGATEYALGTANMWDDDQVQTLLDRHRRDYHRELLTAIPRYASGGTIQWFDYQACDEQWEATDAGTAVLWLEDSTGANAGTANWSADYGRGLFTFTADQAGTSYYLTGRVFDLHGAAAELLTQWRAKLARQFDFSSDGQAFQRSQQVKMLGDMAAEYAAKAWPTMGTMVRSDTAGAGGY